MTLPRVVLVTRRFWPLVGGAETMAARLAAGLHARGAATTILTARWQPTWPTEIEHHGVRVVRLPNPQARGWGTWRYMQSVAAWLRRHRSQFDLVYVSMLKHDAYAAVTAARRGQFPVVLRAEGAGLTGDCHWQLEANCGSRIKRRCQRADAFVAPSPAIERELIVSGYARAKIHYLANGVAIPEPRDAANRRQARADLAEADSSLAIGEESPLAVYTGRLHAMKGLDDLIRAWPQVLARLPNARLWIVGDGPQRAELNDLIGHLGLWGFVYLTGPFDDVEEFLRAADLFVLPSLEEGMSLALLEAMAMGLPVIASAIPANEVVVEHGVNGHLVPTRNSERLAAVVSELFEDRGQAERLATAAQERVSQRYSLGDMLDGHLELFQHLVQPGVT
ncbi:MAG TPA: glycosyltransferase family 4 protein [Pirellulales bacterium]|nr:glycosyltransferase family 4 protein [Pirellulales bacterium]